MDTRRLIEFFVELRWRLFRGSIASGGAVRAAAILGVAASIVAGAAVAVAFFGAGQTAGDLDRRALFVIGPVLIVVAVTGLGIIVGVTQPIDPRIIATEPLTDRQLAIGLLSGSAAGPAGIAAGLVGVGVYGGALRGPIGIVPSVLAVGALLATLLLASRSAINALALLTTRRPRAGQFVVGIGSLVFYGSFQFVPSWIVELDTADQQRLADALVLTPPGQLGQALVVADDAPLRALGHVALGSVWLVPLAWVFMASTRRLLVATRRFGGGADDAGERRGVRSLARRACGGGAGGHVAWRGVLTRLRTPRSALETVIGAGLGLAIVLVPVLTRDGVGAGAVLVGGAVQLAVVFMAGNSFGTDGPALGAELLCGVDPEVLVRAKARSIAVVAGPLVVVGPAVAAGVTGEWRYFPAGLLVATGGLLAGIGGAIVQSTLVPVAIPESDNPLASGDSGQGLLGALVLAAVLVALAVVTLPVALALLWAISRDSVAWTSLFAAATVAAGWLALRVGLRIAVRRWREREPEIFAAVVPAR